ncbi:MAG: peptidylprolyl isomerase [Prevotellaceae bacterium]|jgi:peptidyl-prolyl cis-trans isomerase SurA|nr:peptidylprolyl isomerase [Prevotellaceae bacterium]
MIKKLTVIVILTFILLPPAKSQTSLDRVVAVVGNEAILESDIDMLYRDMQIRGGMESLKEGNPRCQILKIFRDQKLLVAQAKLDSLGQGVDNIASSVDRNISALIAQYGKEALEAYYKKSMEQFREESIEFETEQSYARSMQASLASKIKITPSEVAKYFKTMNKDTVPVIIPDQYIIYEIAKKPDSEKAILDVKEKLLGLRKRILDGEKFQTLATLYSEHESAIRGGELGLNPLEGNVLPIRSALSNMRIGQVSKIIESEYGFHVIQLLERQEETGLVNFRQILLKPKYSLEDQATGFARLDSIVKKIEADSITFDDAALMYSENEKSRAGSGLVVNTINEYMGEIRTSFYKDELNPDDFRALEHIGVGEISRPYASTDARSGKVFYKVVMLKEFIPSHPINLKDDFNYISKLYENKKQNEAIEDWVSKKSETEYIRISEKYRECPFVSASWLF